MKEAGGRDTGSADRSSFARWAESWSHGQAAVARFQKASVRLAAAGAKDAHTWAFDALADVPGTARELEAGRALIDVAQSADAAALRQVLRADPACETTSWTVACYRVGDLVPHALRDFTDPAAAVSTLVDCGEDDHLAAELVSSTPDGLCWVALVRTGDQVRFQLFGIHSVLERPGRHGLTDGEQRAVEDAQARWGAVLASWYTAQGVSGPIREARRPMRTYTPRYGAFEAGAALLAPGGRGDDLVGAAMPGASGPWSPGSAGPSGPGVSVDAASAPRMASAAPWGGVSPGAGWGEASAAAAMMAGASGGQAFSTEMFFGIAATLSDLAHAMSDIAEVVERLERSIGSLTSRLDALPAVAGRHALTPQPLAPYAIAPPPRDAVTPAEPARRWWAPRHRATRRPAVGGAVARPL